jgi:hypothetical protein
VWSFCFGSGFEDVFGAQSGKFAMMMEFVAILKVILGDQKFVIYL